MVERFFRYIIHNRIRRGVFQNLEPLIMAIEEYIDGHNQNPGNFIWTTKPQTFWKRLPARRPS